MYLYINIKLHQCKANCNAKQISIKPTFEHKYDLTEAQTRVVCFLASKRMQRWIWLHGCINSLRGKQQLSSTRLDCTHCALKVFVSTSSKKQHSQRKTRSDSSDCVSSLRFEKKIAIISYQHCISMLTNHVPEASSPHLQVSMPHALLACLLQSRPTLWLFCLLTYTWHWSQGQNCRKTCRLCNELEQNTEICIPAAS